MNRKNGDFLSYDEKYMRLAMQLAGNAIGRTSPNPLVGAVIVKDNRVGVVAGIEKQVHHMLKFMH